MTSHNTMGFVILAAVMMVSRPIFAEINCEANVHENCEPKSLYFSQSSNEYLFSDKFLIEHCSDILEDIECKSNFLSTCDHDNHQLYLLLTNGMKELFTELCNETSHLREGYKEHISCYRDSVDRFQECVHSSLQAAQLFHYSLLENNEINEDDEQLKVKGLCFLQQKFRACSINEVRTSCNDAAARYLETLFSMTLQDLVNEVCDIF